MLWQKTNLQCSTSSFDIFQMNKARKLQLGSKKATWNSLSRSYEVFKFSMWEIGHNQRSKVRLKVCANNFARGVIWQNTYLSIIGSTGPLFGMWDGLGYQSLVLDRCIDVINGTEFPKPTPLRSTISHDFIQNGFIFLSSQIPYFGRLLTIHHFTIHHLSPFVAVKRNTIRCISICRLSQMYTFYCLIPRFHLISSHLISSNIFSSHQIFSHLIALRCVQPSSTHHQPWPLTVFAHITSMGQPFRFPGEHGTMRHSAAQCGTMLDAAQFYIFLFLSLQSLSICIDCTEREWEIECL